MNVVIEDDHVWVGDNEERVGFNLNHTPSMIYADTFAAAYTTHMAAVARALGVKSDLDPFNAVAAHAELCDAPIAQARTLPELADALAVVIKHGRWAAEARLHKLLGL